MPHSKQSYVYNCIGCESYHLQPVGKLTQNGNSLKYNPGIGPPVGRECDECGKQFRVCCETYSYEYGKQL